MTCTHIRSALGVYVVGAIEPAERSHVDRHVAFCPSCRDELAALAGLPALLGRVTEEQISEIAQPREELFANVLAEVVAERRQRRWERGRLLFAVAAPIAAAVLGIFVVQSWSEENKVSPVPQPPQPKPTRQLAVDQTKLEARRTAHGVSATMDMSEKQWGTVLTAQITGVPVGTRCKLIAVPRKGKPDAAASWRVSYQGSARFSGSTMLAPDEIARIEIRTVDDKRTIAIFPAR